MALAGISFEDNEDGIEVQLHFDPELPEDPGEATEAQLSALIAFQTYMRARSELDMPDDEEIFEEPDVPFYPHFDDGESEEASREV